MKNLFVWPGGKRREFKHILDSSNKYNKDVYAEPFLGSGFTFLNIEGYKKYLINDISIEVVNFFEMVKEQNGDFLKAIKKHIDIWEDGKFDLLNDVYENDYIKEQEEIYFKKWGKNELAKETLKKMLYYNFIRKRYNESLLTNDHTPQSAADFIFIRQYSFSGMLRYSQKGNYNVPYGGFRYNKRSLKEKYNLIISDEMKEKMKRTKIYCEDFKKFLTRIPGNSFVFFDPPYDSEFTSYTKDHFTFEDQKDLSKIVRDSNFTSYMIMLGTDRVIKLYKGKEFDIAFNSYTYGINIKNRQEENTKVKHIYVTKE